MILTSFDNPIIFRVNPEFTVFTEEILRKWITVSNELRPRNEFFLNNFYRDVFPLKWPTLYIVSIKWANPCQPYNHNHRGNDNYFWLTIDKEENIADFDALLRLQFRSTLPMEKVENLELVKQQLIEEKESITIKTI